jgi:hypothetical protein
MRFIHVISLIFIFLQPSSLFAITGSPTYISAKLASIGKNLSKDVSITGSEIKYQPLTGKYTIVIVRDNNNCINHIGISLFSNDVKKMLNAPICNFMERYLLELLLAGSNQAALFVRESSDVHLLHNGVLNTNAYSFARSFIANVDTSFVFTYDDSYDKGVVATWSKGNNRYALQFKPERQLVYGTDKKESDQLVNDQLTDEQGTVNQLSTKSYPLEDLSVYDNAPLYYKKGIVFTVQSMNSDTYYMPKGNIGEAVFSNKYPAESIKNLLLGVISTKKVRVNIRHSIYGRSFSDFVIPLAKVFNLVDKDTKLYCGIENITDDAIKADLVIQYDKLNYIHLLRFTIKRVELFGDNPVANVFFYSNIPQQNINNIIK